MYLDEIRNPPFHSSPLLNIEEPKQKCAKLAREREGGKGLHVRLERILLQTQGDTVGFSLILVGMVVEGVESFYQ